MSIGSGVHTPDYLWLQSPWWTELRSVICTGHMLRSMLWLQPNGSSTPPPCAPLRPPALLCSPLVSVQPYLPGLIKLPVRGKGRCRSCGWGVATAPVTDRKRGIMKRVVQKRKKGKGAIIDVDRNRHWIQPLVSCISTRFQPLPTPKIHTCSHMHVYHISTTLPTLFCILLVHSVPHLVPHLSFPLSFILVQSLHIFSSNWHFPFANLFSYRLPASVAKATAMDP